MASKKKVCLYPRGGHHARIRHYIRPDEMPQCHAERARDLMLLFWGMNRIQTRFAI